MKPGNFLSWVLLLGGAVIITIAAVIYQNITGPTHSKRFTFRAGDQKEYPIVLPRSHGGMSNCMVSLNIPDSSATAQLIFRRFPTKDEWTSVNMKYGEDGFSASLPHQPPAGKLEYYILISQKGEAFRLPEKEQVVIRFRGDVPPGVLIPHIFLMFAAMLLSNLTLLLAIFNIRGYKLFTSVTMVVLFAGGLTLGPIVQKFAFGQFWTGFPIGYDLTDNKTLIAFLFWLVAVAGNVRKNRRMVVIIASVVMLIIFSVPHSARGSELDPETGQIKTGWINAFAPNLEKES
jgi:hypothetical protein